MPQSFKYRVLLVDDYEPFLTATATALSSEGYVVETARDGFEALAVLRGSLPDILISDLRMPNMSGFELLAVVRKRFPGIGVIAVSGEFLPAGKPEGVLADRCITKGENCHFELLEAVREVLSESPMRAQPSKPELAPAWLPRSQLGYVVVTCPGCLRSFSVQRSQAEPGLILKDACIHCGAEVAYRIDTTTVREQPRQPPSSSETSHALVDSSKKMVVKSKEKIARTKELCDQSGDITERWGLAGGGGAVLTDL